MSTPKAFLSYSWDDESHKKWAVDLATKLRGDGIETIIDQWHAIPGDQLPAFMETEIRDNDYVLIICTPNYKLKSDRRAGGVGYEGDIMTGEVHTKGNHRKFIPILARGNWLEASPTWLAGKYYIDLSSANRWERNYTDLITTLLGTRSIVPPVKKVTSVEAIVQPLRPNEDEPIKILGVVADKVTEPKLDGSPGSALYTVPFRLNKRPSSLWNEIFIQTWNHPPSFTSMHRPGIANVVGVNIILAGTTLDEVKQYHRDTLILCVQEANQKEIRILKEERRKKELLYQKAENHRQSVRDGLDGISF